MCCQTPCHGFSSSFRGGQYNRRLLMRVEFCRVSGSTCSISSLHPAHHLQCALNHLRKLVTPRMLAPACQMAFNCNAMHCPAFHLTVPAWECRTVDGQLTWAQQQQPFEMQRTCSPCGVQGHWCPGRGSGHPAGCTARESLCFCGLFGFQAKLWDAIALPSCPALS